MELSMEAGVTTTLWGRYRAIAEHAGGTVDLCRLVRRVQDELRTLEAAAARELLFELAGGAPDPRACFVLERFAEELDPAGPPPFSQPWDWAAFYLTGRGAIVLEGRPA